ncbi:PIN domain-containing protein [Synoicihabitans lomoniglobus]|uniref:PIN domain-containing protein n=1 Tax=Synoicihabitans lomoniglobus TaxID=2909285 RepID=A0AAE9ZVZ3_9BACT|nr:PIN domain-containing protein [Opitutaceae bacterium LMO-M01]WED64179.1 PIN domain-containing protein [Opitutaceae bacterium LMO-M01]
MSEFLDTNVFVYSVSVDPADAPKRDTALELLGEADIHLSIQVVQEFINTCLKKARLGQPPQALERTVRQLLTYPCQQPGPDSILRALEIRQRFQTSYWDAAIIAAAQELGCHTLYSEDLNHGQDYDGLKVINPFR